MTIENIGQFDLPFNALKALLQSKPDAWIESRRAVLPLDTIEHIRLANFFGFEFGVRLGWWEDWDLDGPVSAAQTFSIAALGEGATVANIVAALGIFPSITQAKKNGFNGPLVEGIHEFTKRKIRVRIVP